VPAVGGPDDQPRIGEEALQVGQAFARCQLPQQRQLVTGDLEDRDLACLAPAAGCPGRVSRAEPDDRDALRRRVDDRRDGAEAGASRPGAGGSR
jgi:hypothetical protein